ncbi:phosphotransferase enzyme family [Fusarium sp. NRRL 52700]|nr:phosphotransferase enzyme family [Fusarium sp. NRRL 52700]
MDFDDRFALDNKASSLSWIRRYDDHTTTDKLKDNLHAYNLSCKVEFENGEKWIVRFSMVGKVVHADEKIEAEVATMKLIRQQTTIPVPDVKAWVLAVDNVLGIGPFIMMGFIEGISVDRILQNPDARIMQQDVSDNVIETIFRQMVDFLLQLLNRNFSCIGSLTSGFEVDFGGFSATVCSRPLSKKSHDFLLDGGVDVFGKCNISTMEQLLTTSPAPRSKTFASTAKYFHYIIDGDLQHLHDQPNSVDNEHDAREMYIYFNIMKSLVSRHFLLNQDTGPFKLTCDDLQPTNMIVNNEQDLKIVGVLDWEWSYAAPAQLASTPWWLLIESSNVWSYIDKRLDRFDQLLELYEERISS